VRDGLRERGQREDGDHGLGEHGGKAAAVKVNETRGAERVELGR